jgi:hypothetical protein
MGPAAEDLEVWCVWILGFFLDWASQNRTWGKTLRGEASKEELNGDGKMMVTACDKTFGLLLNETYVEK